MVRAGDRPDEIDALRAAGLIGLRYETVGNALEWSVQQIEVAIAATKPDELSAQLRSRLMRFAQDMRVGDLVVTPDQTEHLLWLSTVVGPYTYHEADPPVAGFRHTREVRPLGWVARSAPWLRHKLDYLDNPASVGSAPAMPSCAVSSSGTRPSR